MKLDVLEEIAAALHQVWMDLYVERDGEEKAKKHPHFKIWNELHAVPNSIEAMNQDRFSAAQILQAFAKGVEKDQLPAVIQNSVLFWIMLSGEQLRDYHVPYSEANERAIKERTTQTEKVWPILQAIGNIEEIRKCDWLL